MMSSGPMIWTDAMKEKLIKSVKSHECIWNFADPDYRNASKKKNIFDDIAKNMTNLFGINFRGNQAYRQWQSLRDQYRRAKRRLEFSCMTMKPWRFIHILKFTDATDAAEANDPLKYIYNSLMLDKNIDMDTTYNNDESEEQNQPSLSPSSVLLNSLNEATNAAERRKASRSPSAMANEINNLDKQLTTACTLTATATVTGSNSGHYTSLLTHAIAGTSSELSGCQKTASKNLLVKQEEPSIESDQPSPSSLEAVLFGDQPNGNENASCMRESNQACLKRKANSSPPYIAQKRERLVCDSFDEYTLLGHTVERKVRVIAQKNPRLGLEVQKKINDAIYEAAMNLLDVQLLSTLAPDRPTNPLSVDEIFSTLGRLSVYKPTVHIRVTRQLQFF